MKSVNNIWKISEKGGTPVQVTHHQDGNLYFPSISADRKTIVYEENFGLWKLDVASGKSTEIVIDIKSDSKENETELVTLERSRGLPHLALEPARGDRRARRDLHGRHRSRRAAARQRDAVARTGCRAGRRTASGSPSFRDRTGRQEVWISDELGKNAKKLSDVDCDKSSIIWAPDSKSLLWAGSDHKLRRVDVDSGKTDVVATTRRGRRRRPAVFARRQVDLLFQAGQAAAHARLGEGAGDRAGAHDHVRPVPDLAGREVDAGREEAAADRRRESAGDGVAGLPRHAQPALRDFAARASTRIPTIATSTPRSRRSRR